ncbi:hypothetical protein [Clostridium grantii]|uniref:Uncharacterized protein n=1 Tax=Clostridium grantii DSM 8605 TaxID=1121316 RepID=A0A1M5RBT8_9CLOT|nr:hypothetical protein [Clostridium grantii]SHH23506.1 hypothetical protein SAMN02745207_00430 [Clostridium grantii DSM 8605]
MNKKLSEREKLMAYVLNKEFRYPQNAIANLMSTKHDGGISQPSIANAIKEAGYLIQIKKLKDMYLDVKKELEQDGFIPSPNLLENRRNIISFDE